MPSDATPAPGFFLREATAAERVARNRLTFDTWGERLTLPQYLDRERLLRQTEHGIHDMHTWVLRVPNGTVMASAETFRLPLLPGGVAEVIASVYVDKPLRGVGLASRMLRALVEYRREAGIDALLLFSEVGTELYERLGFRLLPAPTRRVPARESPLAPGVTLHGHDDLSKLLEARLAFRAGEVDFRLTPAIVEWHRARARFYGETLHRPVAETLGASTADAQVLWVTDVKHLVLRILDASGRPGADLGPLLDAAANEAHRLRLRRAELWDDTHSQKLAGPAPEPRDDDLPMGQSFTPRGELLLGPLSRATWA